MYVSTQYPHTQIDLNTWCNTNQEIVAVHVRLQQGTVILVSTYIRPASSARIRLGWFAHLRRAYPGTPILVGGDFNAPHMEWGYAMTTRRGTKVHDTFLDAACQLLHHLFIPTRTTTTHSPDLSWWMGHRTLHWHVEPDAWGSDHLPILIDLHPHTKSKVKRKAYTTNWDKFRSLTADVQLSSSTLSSTLRRKLKEATAETWVEEAKPNPDMHVLNLWAARKRADIAARRNPDSLPDRIRVNRLTAKARQYQKVLSQGGYSGAMD